MYTPKHFQKHDSQELISFIENYPLGTLVCSSGDRLEANHIPFYVDQDSKGDYYLKGHIAKANTLWQDVKEYATTLTIFQGPNSYISPNWYPTKQEHGKAVPTWNYIAVHVEGKIRFIDDNAWKQTMLETLTTRAEASQENPWRMSDAPEDFIKRQLHGVIGLELKVTSMHGKWKLSQNQPTRNQNGVISALSLSDHARPCTMAEIMIDEVINKP